MATPVPSKITDHADRAIARVPGWESESPNILRLFRALTAGTQNIEDALDDLINKRATSTAEGVQLDNLGTILDFERVTGQTDSQYAAALVGRAAAIASSGTAEQLISTYLLLFSPDSVLSTDLQPATFLMTAVVPAAGDDGDPADVDVVKAMNEAKAAGVQLILQICASPCFLWGSAADADASGDLPPSASGFGGIAGLVADGTTTYVAAGAADTDVGAATGQIDPASPAGHAAGDLLLVYVSGRGNGYAFTPPPEWTQVFQFDHSTGAAPNTIACFAKRAVSASEPTPPITWTGGVANGDVIAQMAAWRPSAGSDIVLVKLGAESDNANTETDVGPISAIATDIETTDLLVVFGHRADDWTGVATLTGDGEAWAEVGEPVSALGDDAGIVWGYSILTGNPPAITAKTFSVTGGVAAHGVGIMASFRVTKGDIAPGDGGGNFARVL